MLANTSKCIQILSYTSKYKPKLQNIKNTHNHKRMLANTTKMQVNTCKDQQIQLNTSKYKQILENTNKYLDILINTTKYQQIQIEYEPNTSKQQ